MSKIKIKNSVVIVNTSSDCESSIKEELKNFEIADKTPIDCMDFVRRLLKKIRRNGID